MKVAYLSKLKEVRAASNASESVDPVLAVRPRQSERVHRLTSHEHRTGGNPVGWQQQENQLRSKGKIPGLTGQSVCPTRRPGDRFCKLSLTFVRAASMPSETQVAILPRAVATSPLSAT